MKTEKTNVHVWPLLGKRPSEEMSEEECVVLYEDDTFKMLFYNVNNTLDANVELIIKNKTKTWYQWGFDEEPIRAINYLGCGKLSKYKQDLIYQGFELMRKVEAEKEKKHNKELDEWIALRYPTTEDELDFLFNEIK